MNLDYGNILMRSLQITWRHKSFWLFMTFPMLIASLMFAALVVPVFILDENDEMAGLVFALWAAVLVIGMLASTLAGTAGMASLTLGILRSERGKGSTSFMDLVRDGFSYFGRSLGVMLIVQLTMGLVFTLFFLCMAALIAVTVGIAAICLQPVMLLMTPLSFLVVAVMDGALVAVIDEDLGAWDAVKRAFEVVRAHFWKFVLISIIVYLGTTILTSIAVLPAMFPAMVIPAFVETSGRAGGVLITLSIILFAILFFGFISIVTGITGAFMTSAMELSYLQLSRPGGNGVVFAPDEPQNATS